ncbi:MAG: hypothetical protein HQL24_01785 [Candidatus Omnitrophica bacterium]|nr:hypothetical protein [Candidatus Omnitrophota bacterium]
MDKNTKQQERNSLRALLRVILFLAFLELFFYIDGGLSIILQDYQNRYKLNQENTFRILCIGESMSYDGENFSYPTQLETILNARSQKHHFKIINKAIPGEGSDVAVQRLNSWIEEYHPHIVVAMMGINDYVDSVPFDKKTWPQKFLGLLDNVRVYKVAKTLVKDAFPQKQTLEKDFPSNTARQIQATQSFGQIKSLPDIIEEKLKKLPPDLTRVYLVALFHEGKKHYEAASFLFQKLTEANLDPVLTEWTFQKWGDTACESKNYTEYVKVMRHKLEKNPEDPWVAEQTWRMCRDNPKDQEIVEALNDLIKTHPNTRGLHDILGGCLAETGQKAEAEKHWAKAEELRGLGKNPITHISFTKFFSILKQKDITAVVVQYPMRSLSLLKNLLEDIDGASEAHYVDNNSSFREALKRGSYSEYFKDRAGGNFGHCTPKGYRIIANNVANVILKSFE